MSEENKTAPEVAPENVIKTYRIIWDIGNRYGGSIEDIFCEIIESHGITDYKLDREPQLSKTPDKDGHFPVNSSKITFSIQYRFDDKERYNEIKAAEDEITKFMRRNRRVLDAFVSATKTVSGGCLIPTILIALAAAAIIWIL